MLVGRLVMRTKKRRREKVNGEVSSDIAFNISNWYMAFKECNRIQNAVFL